MGSWTAFCWARRRSCTRRAGLTEFMPFHFPKLLLLAPVFAACVALAQQPKRVDDAALRKAASDEWVTYGHDYAETHFSPLKQINAENVNRLGLAWTWATGTE